MKVTEINLTRVQGELPLLAYVNIVFDDSIAVKDIKLIRAEGGGFFVSMPARKRRNGGFADIVHPINSKARRMIQDAITEEYRRSGPSDTPPA